MGEDKELYYDEESGIYIDANSGEGYYDEGGKESTYQSD